MKKVLLTSMYLFKATSLFFVFCLLLFANTINAQIITENNFEETGWVTNATNGMSSSSSTRSTRSSNATASGNLLTTLPFTSSTSVPVFSTSYSVATATGAASTTWTGNTFHSWYSAMTTGLYTSTVTNSFSSIDNGATTTSTYTKTWLASFAAIVSNNVLANSGNYIHSGTKSMNLNGNKTGYIITPLLQGTGNVTVSFWVATSQVSASNNVQVVANTNTTITASTAAMSKLLPTSTSNGTTSSWTGSNYASNATFLNNAFSWYQVSFTTSIGLGASAYFKIQNASAATGVDVYIDDILITQDLPPITYNYYKPVATGSLASPVDWNTPANWQGSADGVSNWTVCTSIPFGAGTVDIPTGYFVTVDAATSIPATTVEGYLRSSSTLTPTATLTVANGGIYEHAQNSSTFPAIIWQAGSTLKLTGNYTASSNDLPISTYQNIWFAGSVVSGGYFRLANGSANTIGGEVKVSSTGAGDFLISSINNTIGQTVASFVQTGGNVMVNRDAASGTRALTILGNLDVSGGTFYVKQGGTNVSTGTLNINGNITVSGTGSIVKTGAGTANIIFNGSTQQTITGLTGSGTSGSINLTLNNSAGLLLGSNMDIGSAASLNVSAGTLNLNGNTVTLKSDAAGTARVAAIAGTIDQSISGSNFSVQKYILAKRAYRFFGHPFNSSIAINQLMTGSAATFTGIDITGAGGASNGFTPSNTNNPSAFYYNNAAGNSSITPTDPGWAAFTSASASNWAAMQGIRVLVRGTKDEGINTTTYTPSTTTVTMSGKINDGSSPTFTLLRSTPSTGEYNLIANPLASQIDLSLTTRGSAVGANFSVWNPDIGNGANKGVYLTQPFATPYVLPLGGAFFATTTDGAANNTIQFTEAAKVGTPAAALFRGNSVFGSNSINLELTDVSGYADRLLLFFNKNKSSNNKDWWDAEKLANTDVNMYSTSADNKKLSVDARPLPILGSMDLVIPVTLNTPTARNFTLTAKDFDMQDPRELLLHDRYNNTWTILNKDVAYNFTVTNDAATQGERFEIVMKQSPALALLATTFSLKLSPNPARDIVKVSFTNEANAVTTITITNAEGKIVSTVEVGNVQSGEVAIPIKALAKGNYFVTFNNGKERKTEKLLVQ